MSEFNSSVVAQALLRQGRPFIEHGLDDAPCARENGGILNDPRCSYLAVDLNGEGYSCDGLIRRAICEAAGVELGEFSTDYTHLHQWADLMERRRKPRSDLIVVFLRKKFDVPVHAALQLDDGYEIFHATNREDENGEPVNMVTFGRYSPDNNRVRYIDPSRLAEVAITGLS